MTYEKTALFQPLQVGRVTLQHKVVMAPLTRCRADENHVHIEAAIKYYAQRASVPGTLIISEATYVSLQGGGRAGVPGLWTEEQIRAWRKITDAVHAKGCFMYCQIWALGRAADPKVLGKSGFEVVSSSDVPMKEGAPVPRPLTLDEISSYVDQFGHAAKCAVEAGFDGVEIHGANGYLVDQFTQDVCNKRTDQYGGSIENRCRFALEIVQSCVKAIGADRVAIRLSPYSKFQAMKMADPIPTFTYLIKQLPRDLAYLHLVESRIAGSADSTGQWEAETTKFAQDLWSGPFFTAGGYLIQTAVEATEANDKVAVVMGRYFVSNPDLVARMKLGVEFRAYDRSNFYTSSLEGYTTYEVDESLIERASKL